MNLENSTNVLEILIQTNDEFNFHLDASTIEEVIDHILQLM